MFPFLFGLSELAPERRLHLQSVATRGASLPCTIDISRPRTRDTTTGPIGAAYTAARASEWAEKVARKVGALNCIGYIDGTVLEIARPDDAELYNGVYHGHKRKHALNFQAVTTADGIFYHVYGPVEGRSHDWTLFVRSDLDTQLEEVMKVGDRQLCTFGDSGYNVREYLEIPFQGSDLNENQRAFNRAMSGA